jgi:hypothetical protein
VLELRAAKEIKGALSAPPSADLLILSLAVAVAVGVKTRISPVCATPRVEWWMAAFKSVAEVVIEGNECIVTPFDKKEQTDMRLSYDDLPYRDCLVFLLLGRLGAVAVERLPDKRFDRWARLAHKAGHGLRREGGANDGALILDKKDHFNIPEIVVDVEEAHAFLGLALGLNARFECIVDQAFSSPLRQLLPRFGLECVVKNTARGKAEDPLVRRLRFLKTGKKTEGPVQFSLRADFSKPPLSEATITVPGDDVFAALMVLAKCLVPKGSLVIENVGLEAWNTQALQLLKTMGGTVGTNETGISSFGPMGTVIVQKTNAFGRKIECRPWWQFAAQLPTMAVMAAFAQGQSIFRGLEDPREDEPDGLARIIGCLAALGVRYGEMPDGIVIEGSKQFDGFDINVALPAPIAGAFAVSALKCRGPSAIADDHIVKYWPDFKDALYSVCDFKE